MSITTERKAALVKEHGRGKDDTLFAKIPGIVEFRDRGRMGKFVNIVTPTQS